MSFEFGDDHVLDLDLCTELKPEVPWSVQLSCVSNCDQVLWRITVDITGLNARTGSKVAFGVFKTVDDDGYGLVTR